jgi:WD40 repeat protein
MLLTVDFPSPIARVCLSPKATRLALANEVSPPEVLVVALPSGKPVARFSGLGVRPRLAFRSEAQLFITHGRECWLCDVTRQAHRALDLGERPTNRTGSLYCCRVGPGGRTVALAGENEGIVVVNLTGRGAARRLPLWEEAWTEGLEYSPDGSLIAATMAPTDEDRVMRLIRIRDARSGKEVRFLKLPWVQFYVYPTAFSPDNRTLAVGWQSKVLLYELYPPKGPLDPEVLFGDDWTLHSVGWSRPIACHDLGEKKEVTRLWVSSKRNFLKVLCDRGEALVMSAKSGKVLRETPVPTERPNKVWGADISPGGRAAVRVDEKTVLIWDVPGWDKV